MKGIELPFSIRYGPMFRRRRRAGGGSALSRGEGRGGEEDKRGGEEEEGKGGDGKGREGEDWEGKRKEGRGEEGEEGKGGEETRTREVIVQGHVCAQRRVYVCVCER